MRARTKEKRSLPSGARREKTARGSRTPILEERPARGSARVRNGPRVANRNQTKSFAESQTAARRNAGARSENANRHLLLERVPNGTGFLNDSRAPQRSGPESGSRTIGAARPASKRTPGRFTRLPVLPNSACHLAARESGRSRVLRRQVRPIVLPAEFGFWRGRLRGDVGPRREIEFRGTLDLADRAFGRNRILERNWIDGRFAWRIVVRNHIGFCRDRSGRSYFGTKSDPANARNSRLIDVANRFPGAELP